MYHIVQCNYYNGNMVIIFLQVPSLWRRLAIMAIRTFDTADLNNRPVVLKLNHSCKLIIYKCRLLPPLPCPSILTCSKQNLFFFAVATIRFLIRDKNNLFSFFHSSPHLCQLLVRSTLVFLIRILIKGVPKFTQDLNLSNCCQRERKTQRDS